MTAIGRIRAGLVALLLVFVLTVPAFAQETPPEAEPPPDPAFGALLALATSVFFVVELVKPTLNRWRDNYAWSENVHQFAVRLLAAAAALVLIFSIPTDANIIRALGLTWQVPDWIAKVITALAVSGGATFLHALQSFFKLMPAPTIVAATVEEVRRE